MKEPVICDADDTQMEAYLINGDNLMTVGVMFRCSTCKASVRMGL